MKDGWHKIQGYDVYVENDKILSGLKPSYTGIGSVTAYPYKESKRGGWDNVAGISASAFSKGVSNGSIALF
jgi:hypothetical protein